MGFIKYGYAGISHRIHLPLPEDLIVNAAITKYFLLLRNILENQTGRRVEAITYRDYDDIDFTIACDAELQAAVRYAQRFDPGGELHIFIRVGQRIPVHHVPYSEAAPAPSPAMKPLAPLLPPAPAIKPLPPPPPRAKSSPRCKSLRPPPPPKSNLATKPLPPPPKSSFVQKTSPPPPESNLLPKPPQPQPKEPISPPKPRPKPKRRPPPPPPRVRFDVHDEVSCYTCEMNPIVGVRHWCVSRPSINLCTTCRANNDDADAMQWREIKWPWQEEDAAHTVPDAPLWHGHYSSEVKLLQKCLLKLGFLRPEHVDKLVGHYQDNTAAAVAGFRDAYDVPDGEYENNEVYCSETARVLAKVLDL